jgi:hypothetical protein
MVLLGDCAYSCDIHGTVATGDSLSRVARANGPVQGLTPLPSGWLSPDTHRGFDIRCGVGSAKQGSVHAVPPLGKLLMNDLGHVGAAFDQTVRRQSRRPPAEREATRRGRAVAEPQGEQQRGREYHSPGSIKTGTGQPMQPWPMKGHRAAPTETTTGPGRPLRVAGLPATDRPATPGLPRRVRSTQGVNASRSRLDRSRRLTSPRPH